MMDENTWRLAQVLMWIGGIQTTLILAVFGMMWRHFNSRFEKIDDRFGKVDDRFDRIETRLTRIENDMIEIKTILRLKEGCVIKDSSQVRKAE